MIDRVHQEFLVTPSVQSPVGKLWEKASDYWVSKDAERLVQRELHIGLTMAFSGCRVRAEQSQATGRIDLEIEEADPADSSTVTRHALLELKVLRTCGSTGGQVSDRETRARVKEGVGQAATYRDERGTRESALCCFDMRRPPAVKACTPTITKLADKLSVKIRMWLIYPSARAYRDALVVAAS